MNYKSFAALLQYKFWNTWALMSGLLLSQTAVVSFWMFIFSLFSITYVVKGICISRPPALCLAPAPGPGHQFLFTGPGLQFVFTGPGPQFVFTGPGPKFVFTGPGPQFVFTGPGPNFYLPALFSSKPGLADTNLVPPICIYWPWPTIFITVLWICIYLLIYSSSSGSSNINNSSNFLGLDNTHISMPILVN